MSGPDAPMCAATSKPLVRGKPDSCLICTQDRGHGGMYHSACDGRGHIRNNQSEIAFLSFLGALAGRGARPAR